MPKKVIITNLKKPTKVLPFLLLILKKIVLFILFICQYYGIMGLTFIMSFYTDKSSEKASPETKTESTKKDGESKKKKSKLCEECGVSRIHDMFFFFFMYCLICSLFLFLFSEKRFKVSSAIQR